MATTLERPTQIARDDRPAVTLEIDADQIGVLTIDQPAKKLNVMDLAFIEDFDAVIQGLPQDLRGLIVRSGKENNFIAGADLEQVMQASAPEQAEEVVRALQRTLNRLSDLPYPSVAAINGPALGGGLEIALACDYRVAAENEAPILGLPEVQLGILPAGGGCQRLPRLIGLTRALGLILEGKRYNPRRAKRYGVVDDVVHPAILSAAARALLTRGKRADHPVWSWFDRAAERSTFLRSLVFRQSERAVRTKTRGHYPAPLKALEAIRAGVEQGFGAGLAAAAVAFGELSTGPVARNLIGLFLAREQLKREQRRLSEVGQEIRNIGVVGSGFMGSGIAQASAVAGFESRMRDVKPEQVARGVKAAIGLTLNAARKGRFSRQEAQNVISRLSGTTDYSGFKRTDLVIEAVFEDVVVKQQVIAELEDVLSDGAIIASNTSSLPIACLAAEAKHAERIAGMHFFSPVHKMPLVEVIRAELTSDRAVATCVEAGRAMGKTVVVVNDGPGFFTTRVISFMLGQAGQLFEEGASVEAVDNAMTLFGFPIGPFALSDEVGLDVGAHVSQTLRDAFPMRFDFSPAISKLVEQGRLGRKSGRGFYDYSKRKKKVDQSIYSFRSRPPRSFPPKLIQDRLVLAFVNEAAHCLSEGLIANARDGDVASVMGIGFPPFLGGPFRYADSLGLATVLQELEQLAEAHGSAFQPASVFGKLLDANERFYER